MSRDVKIADRGFTMIVVLWVIALLTLILSGFLRSAGTHTGIAVNTLSSARAEGLADAGVHLAVLDLIQVAGGKTAFAAIVRNSDPRSCRAGPGETITIRIQDASGRVDLNAANHAMLAALIAGLGASAADAAATAAAVIDFRDRDSDPLPGGAEEAGYAANGLKVSPKNAPFDTIEELEHVFGFTIERVKSLLPHVTLPAVMPSHLIPEWGLSYSDGGLMAASYAAGYMLAVPVLTTLTDRIDARRILFWGSLMSGLATILFGLLASGLWYFRHTERTFADVI